MTRYFFGEASGVNADIERHRAQEADLLSKINDLSGSQDPMDVAVRYAYQRLLGKLRQSKADAVSKLGRTKRT